MSSFTSTPNRRIPPGIRDPARRIISNKDIGDRVTFTKYSTETPNGDYFQIRCIVKPGGGVPLHFHHNCSEHFKVLRGTLTAVNGTETVQLKVGEETLVPIMTNHLFRNDTNEEAEFEGTARLVGFEGKEQMERGKDILLGFQMSLYILYGLANDGLCEEDAKPKSLVDAAVALRLGDFAFAGSLPYRWTMGSIFGVADWIGWWKGREEELLKRYWD